MLPVLFLPCRMVPLSVYGGPIFRDARVSEAARRFPDTLRVAAGLAEALDTDLWERILADQLKVEDALTDEGEQKLQRFLSEEAGMTQEEAEATLQAGLNLTAIIEDADLGILEDISNSSCSAETVAK